MASLGDLSARVGADVSGFSTAMDQVVKKASDTVDATEQRFAAFANVGQSLAVVGAGMTAAITLPIVGIGAAATQSFGEFQGAMNRASALGDIYGADLDKLKAQAIDLGAKTQFSAKQAADGMAELSASGFNTTQIMAAMPAVLNLAAAGQLSVGQSAEIASNIMGGFGIKAEGVGHAVDVMAKAAASGSLGVNDLAFTFKYVGPVATAAGVSFEEVAAATTLLSNAGIKGEQAGTSLRSAIANLISPPKKAAEALAELGVTTTDSTGKLRPLNEIFGDLKNAGISTAQTFAIFGKETASAAAALINVGGPAIADMTKTLVSSEGAADKMAKTLTGGLGGAMERMKGSIETAGIALGEVLAPVIVTVAGWIEKLANGASSVITWFQGIPAPIQNMALAAVGLIAALGPVLTAIGGIGLAIPAVATGLAAISSAIGIAVAPMLAGAAAIAAIAVALVGLGTWVADNWEPIKASLLQAWDGLTDLWMASWGPIITNLQTVWTNIGTVASTVWGAIVTFLSNLWTPVGSAVESVWNGISTFLGNVWNGISSTASTVWNGIVSVFQTFLDWAGKIPGVNKLMNLDEAWDHAKKLEKQVKNTTTAVKDHGTAHKDAKPKVEGMTTALGHVKDAHEKHTKAVKDHKQPADKFSKQALDHVEKLTDLKRKLDTAKAEQELLTTAFKNGEGPVQAMARALDDVKVSLQNIVPKFDTVQDVIGKTITPANDLNAAFKALGVTSSTDLKTAADNAKTHYDTIKNSGIATKGEIEAAWQAMTKAEIDYRESVGKDATALETELEKHTGKHRKHRDDVKTVWDDIKAGIDGAIKSFGSNLSNIIGGLFTGDFSIGKLGEAFKNLGLDIADVFLNKAANAIATFVTDHIGSLMTALGNLLSKIPLIGDALGAVFGGTASAGGQAAGGAAGAAGSAAGTAGGAASAVTTSISSVMGMITGAISAVTGVIGLFQNARQEGSLNAIEHNTRYSMMYLGEHGGTSIMDILFRIQELVWYGPLVKAVESIRDSMFMQYALPNLDSIKDSAYWTLQKVDEIRQMMTEPLAFGGGAVASGAGGIAVHIDLRGSTISSDAAARDLADRVAASVTDRLQKELR